MLPRKHQASVHQNIKLNLAAHQPAQEPEESTKKTRVGFGFILREAFVCFEILDLPGGNPNRLIFFIKEKIAEFHALRRIRFNDFKVFLL